MQDLLQDGFGLDSGANIGFEYRFGVMNDLKKWDPPVPECPVMGVSKAQFPKVSPYQLFSFDRQASIEVTASLSLTLVLGVEVGGQIVDDLAKWQPKIEAPRVTNYRGVDVYKLDVWTQGPALLPAGSSVVGGVKVSHPERIIDASSGITKLELVRYYASVADWMLPHLKGRPCSLVRGPSGVGGELFFQKHIESLQITGIKELDAALWPGHAPLLEVPSKKALVAAAQMNVIEFHTWNARVRRIERPDRVIFDLDPGEGERWERVQEAAVLVRGLLQELGLRSWLKTSGGKGLHVVVPLTPRDDWDTVKAFAQALVQHLAQVIPQRFAAKMGAANRAGRLFVDYLRNNHGATTAAAFSARARPGLGVSMPLAWDDLAALKRSDQWTVRTAREHLSFQGVDPWADYWGCRQTLSAALGTLGITPAASAATRSPGAPAAPAAPPRSRARSARA